LACAGAAISKPAAEHSKYVLKAIFISTVPGMRASLHMATPTEISSREAFTPGDGLEYQLSAASRYTQAVRHLR